MDLEQNFNEKNPQPKFFNFDIKNSNLWRNLAQCNAPVKLCDLATLQRSSHTSRSLVIPKHDFWPCNPSWTSWWPLRVSCTFLRWRDKCQVSFGGTTAEFRWYPSLLRKTLCLILLIGKNMWMEWQSYPPQCNAKIRFVSWSRFVFSKEARTFLSLENTRQVMTR